MDRLLRSIRRHALRSLALLSLTFAVLLVASAELRFVVRATWEEARILWKRRPIGDMIADPNTPYERREQLRMVLAARAFAARELGLAAGETYTTFSEVGDGALLHVLSASPKDRLAPYLWHYPVVGSVPYKGFFDEEAARAEQRRLERQGYDTYLRPAGAFSTLGWFNDPLLSTALGDPADLVATVIHEIAHNTLWVPGDVRFNESYANFVGYRGAELFFASRGDGANAARCAAMWQDEKLLGSFWAGLESELSELYGSRLPARVKAARRTRVFARARTVLQGPLNAQLRVYSGRKLGRRPLNNARLIANGLYMSGLEDLDQVYELAGGDLRRGIRRIALTVRRHPSLNPLEAVALMVRTSRPLALPVRRGVAVAATGKEISPL